MDVLETRGRECTSYCKKCIASIRERFTDHQVVVLNGETYSQYITMPDHIERLFKEGHIGEAQYSDLLRISLLYTVCLNLRKFTHNSRDESRVCCNVG